MLEDIFANHTVLFNCPNSIVDTIHYSQYLSLINFSNTKVIIVDIHNLKDLFILINNNIETIMPNDVTNINYDIEYNLSKLIYFYKYKIFNQNLFNLNELTYNLNSDNISDNKTNIGICFIDNNSSIIKLDLFCQYLTIQQTMNINYYNFTVIITANK